MIQVFRTREPVCTQGQAKRTGRSRSAGGLDVPSRLYSLTSLRAAKGRIKPRDNARATLLSFKKRRRFMLPARSFPRRAFI